MPLALLFAFLAWQADGLHIALVGDVMLGRLVNEVLRHKPPAHPWGDVLPVLRRADIRIANLECVISDRGRPWTATPKVFHFRSDAKNVAVLAEAGLHVVSLANNHALDYGYDAMADMLGLLDRAGIRRAGAGKNRGEACRPAFLDAGGIKLAFLAFTDNEPPWEAADQRPGTCYVPTRLDDRRAQFLMRLVSDTRAQAGLLIVSAHWGGNWGYPPPEEHKTFGRALLDAGADVVFGHSAHVFRGIEVWRGKPILYSTGDFVDDYAVDARERNDESFIFLLRVAGGAVQEISLIPTLIRDFQAHLAQGATAERIARRMQTLCAQAGTTAEWDRAARCLRIRKPW